MDRMWEALKELILINSFIMYHIAYHLTSLDSFDGGFYGRLMVRGGVNFYPHSRKTSLMDLMQNPAVQLSNNLSVCDRRKKSSHMTSLRRQYAITHQKVVKNLNWMRIVWLWLTPWSLCFLQGFLFSAFMGVCSSLSLDHHYIINKFINNIMMIKR